MTIIKNMETADKVLAEFEKISLSDEYYVEPYQNGRDHGWAIYGSKNREAVFSEYRNTDQIVVYTGKSFNFNMQGNVPDAQTYAEKTFFGPEEYGKAAIYILGFLLNGQSVTL